MAVAEKEAIIKKYKPVEENNNEIAEAKMKIATKGIKRPRKAIAPRKFKLVTEEEKILAENRKLFLI